MAGEYLRARGIDIDAEMSRIQDDIAETHDTMASNPESSSTFRNVSLTQTLTKRRWDVSVSKGQVSHIAEHDPNASNSTQTSDIDGHGALLAPSLCHPHVHIDKAYLLSHPKYAHLQVEKGDFSEAMTMTGKAKAEFEEWDLLERGQRLIDESIAAGVTHMRAFVEVDAGVGTKCLDAGIKLKKKAEAEGKCIVQLCAFAQLPLYTSSEGDEDCSVIRRLMQDAAAMPEVDVVGSTPYVESHVGNWRGNVEWTVNLSIEHDTHLDFHLDYNLDAELEPYIWYVVSLLKDMNWRERTTNKTVVFGHCTRFTLFNEVEWRRLKKEIGDLPISFVGLPTSDLFMMRTPDRTRGTLDVPSLIKDRGLNACIGINNIGNAFTPYGSCDPLTLACNGVGIYQAGTEQDAELLYECVSTRARKAIGVPATHTGDDENRSNDASLELKVGSETALVLFGSEKEDWRTRKTVAEVVYLYDYCRGRRGYLKGVPTSDGSA